MRKTTILSLFLMALFTCASLFGQNWQIYALLTGFAGVMYNAITKEITFEECGLNPITFSIIFTKGIHRILFFAPLLVVCAEVLLGRLLFEEFINYSLSMLDEQLVFNNSATLVLCIIIIVVIEEIPWRCHFQLHIGRSMPSGWALLIPAIIMTFMSWNTNISMLAIYCICLLYTSDAADE